MTGRLQVYSYSEYLTKALRTILALGLLMAIVASAKASDTHWDVTDTGQPYHDAAFTVHEGSWMSVNVSPDGKMLVFDLLGDIYTLPAEGGVAHLVHGGPAIQRMPSFSPDGTQILYISDAGGSDNIWVSGVDGANARQVSHETVNVLSSPSWGASGDYIVATKYYATFAKMRSSEIRLFHKDGGAGDLLVKTPENQRDVSEAQMSRNGRALYYSERAADTQIYVDANHQNFVIKRRDLHSGATETVVEGFGGATTPQLSPDGKHLAFVRRVKARTVLFIYDTQTHEQIPVYNDLDRDMQADFVPHGAYYPAYDWFPDNRHIAIWGKGKLFRIDTQTGKASEIPFTVTSHQHYTDVPKIKHDLAPQRFTVKAIRHIAVSPDGSRLVFNALGSLWSVSASGGVPKRLTAEARAFASEPAFSPDGRTIAYVEWDDEKGSSLKIMTSAGQQIKTVAASRGIIRQPSFSPDGTKLVYHVDIGNKAMGGFPVKAGLYWVSIRDKVQNYTGVQGMAPYFSPDGERIYYTQVTTENDTGSLYAGIQQITSVESILLNGLEKRIHARSNDTDIHDFHISPDLRWLVFRHFKQYYVMPYRDSGRPVIVSDDGAVPVRRLTESGGEALTWSMNSDKLYWVLGRTIHKVSVDKVMASPGILSSVTGDINLDIKSDTPDGILAFTGGRIITMKGEKAVIEDGTVVVTGNRITAAGTRADTVIPKGAKVIDITGKTLMPGFIDMHGHIDCCGDAGTLPQKQPWRYAALAFGVTTNYDPYSADMATYESREMQLAGRIVSPRWVATGKGIYGRQATPDNSYIPIKNYEDARHLMARKAALGGKIIKSYRQPMRRQRQQLIKAGREAGILTDVEGESHFYNNLSMILDGHMALEHNLPLANYYDDLVQFMAHGGSANTPTLIVLFGEIMGENYMYQTERAWDDIKIKTYVQETNSSYSPLDAPAAAPPYVRGMTSLQAADDIWDIGFRSVARSVKKLDDAGVTINAGSHGQIAGLGLHWEMWLMSEGGMSPYRVLRTATINGAHTLGVDYELGTIEVGKLADLIILDRNPLENIRNSNSIHYTMINGRLYDSYSMNEIGNYDRPRSKFYWELENDNGIDWNKAWEY